MVDRRRQLGVTLIEMLVVLGVIVLLAGAVIVLTLRVQNQAKERVLANTFSILQTALQQFYDYGFRYGPGYEELRFPPDCSGFTISQLLPAMAGSTGTDIRLMDITNHNDGGRVDSTYLQYSGCEVMYYFLSQVPECRQTLARIDGAFVTNKDMYGNDIQIKVGDRPYQPLLRVVDPWGTTLRYDYYVEHLADGSVALPKDFWGTRRDFPVLVSAGPDKRFNTPDDISSGRGKR